MQRLITTLLSIGADPGDEEDLRLRKLLLVAAASMFVLASVVWGAIYSAFGEPIAAAIPWTYAVLPVGNIRSDEYRNFTAIGDTTSLAQRLQTLAHPGQVGIGPHTARLLGDAFPLAPLGPQAVKGKAQPVEPFTLMSA